METYLENVLPALASRGHAIDVWYESELIPGGRPIVRDGITCTHIGRSPDATARTLAEMSRRRTDVIFSQTIDDVATERRMCALAPFIVLLHAYYGACISGAKTHKLPSPRPCHRALGPGCLVQYYPRRCGGLSPVTMIRRYGKERLRQEMLRESGTVAVLSGHMEGECVRQGIDATRVFRLPLFVPGLGRGSGATMRVGSGAGDRLHLAFAGRMDFLKGPGLLLTALELLPSEARRRVQITFVGDGPERHRCEAHARTLRANGVDLRFTGWLTPGECADTLARADLLVVPSIWPEPLGLIGLEAAALGVPAISFDVGGAADWLRHNVTGRLLSGPASAAALARAIEDCLDNPARLRSWGNAAAQAARGWTLDRHVDALEKLLEKSVASSDVGKAHTRTRRT